MTPPQPNLFIHLRLHTAYSLAEGAIKIKDLPKLCQKFGMPAVGITDTHNMFGALEAAMACTESGVQPIIGCQFNIKLDNDSCAPLTVLAQSEEGYKNLMKLVSMSYLREGMHKPHYVTFPELFNYPNGLICLTGGCDGPLAILAQSEVSQAFDLLEKMLSVFGDRLYMELNRHGTQTERKLEPLFLEWAYKLNIPLVATNNVFFEKPEMYEAHDVLLCIEEGSYVADTNRRRVTPQHYFKSSKEMIERFKDLPEAILNTVIIAQRCHFMPVTHKPILPVFSADSGRNETDELKFRSYEGLEQRLNSEVLIRFEAVEHDQIRTQYKERLDYELSIIHQMGFSGYFLIVSDFIQWAKNQEIPVGPGRGSGAGSLVAWVTTITDMDPIQFNLIFERFLNPERVSMPDFDVDFCQDRRDEVIRYVCEKYGMDRVAHIITFGKLQARAVLRDVGRVLQMPYGQVDRISKLVPANPANPVTLEQALEMEPELKKQRKEDETVANLIDIGMKLEGLYRHASTHAAGVVIGDRPLDELVPLYYDERSILPATQFNMKYVEAAGLVKFDFLGLKTLTVIDQCCQMVSQRIGKPFKIQNIPLNDPKTFQLLCRVETVGIFQLESGGMRDVLRKLQPDHFEDLIALVALYRPGPMDDIPRYLACKHGQEAVTYLHPALEPILSPTYGVMVYQEQVMQIAQVLGGYTLGAADLLRRAMGKKIKSEMDAQRELFVKGAVDQGVSDEIASQIFDLMAKFAGYGFNKSHSAPYALLAYQTAYLKANHPLEFFAATMTYDMHNTDKLNVYRQDMQKLGIKMLSPDINYSSPRFTVDNEAVRYGLAAIKNVGEQAMESLIQEREAHGKFQDINNLTTRIDPRVVNKRQLEHLIMAGALDSLHDNRGQIHESIDSILAVAQLTQQERKQKQNLLFGGEANRSAQSSVQISTANDWNMFDRLQKEFESLGFYLSAHPLDMYGDIINQSNFTSSFELSEKSGLGASQVVQIAGIVLSKQERTSKQGNKFAFITCSDAYGVFEVTVFLELLGQARHLMEPGTPIAITAFLRSDGEGYRLSAQQIQPLEEKSQNSLITFIVEDGADIESFVAKLTTIPTGNIRICISVQIQNLPTAKIALNRGFQIDLEKRAELLNFKGIRIAQ